jgi:hypothetical protein
MSFYIKLITGFSEAPTYYPLTIYKKTWVCVCCAVLKWNISKDFFSLIYDIHELCARLNSELLMYLPPSNEP